MRKNVLYNTAIVLLVLLNLFQLAGNYFQLFPKQPSRHEEGSGYILRQLHFDRGQADRYKILIDAHKNRVEVLRADLYRRYAGLYGLVGADTIPAAKRDSIQNDICRLHQAINSENMAHFEDVKGLCRPDQLPHFSVFLDEMLIRLGPGKK